jgi:hypothetical protein
MKKKAAKKALRIAGDLLVAIAGISIMMFILVYFTSSAES